MQVAVFVQIHVVQINNPLYPANACHTDNHTELDIQVLVGEDILQEHDLVQEKLSYTAIFVLIPNQMLCSNTGR